MREYELVIEIFNQCSGNQMRNVSIKEIEIADPKAFVDDYLKAYKTVEMDETHLPDGSVIFDVVTDGLHQRISFTVI